MNYAQANKLSTIDPLWIERCLAFMPLLFALIAILLATTQPALAASLPWETPLRDVACSLKGPVAKSVAVIAIVISGLLLAVAEMGGIFKSMLGLLAGLSMALLAANWLGFIDSASSFSC